jgi:hypothetical protein
MSAFTQLKTFDGLGTDGWGVYDLLSALKNLSKSKVLTQIGAWIDVN